MINRIMPTITAILTLLVSASYAQTTLSMGGTAYPCTQAGLTAALTIMNARGGTLDASACTSLSVTTPNDIGDGVHSVTLKFPLTGMWTVSGIANGSSCFFTVRDGSSVLGGGPGNGGSQFKVYSDASANFADSIFCTLDNSYTRIEGGFGIESVSGTFVNGLVHWRRAFDSSLVRSITILNRGGIGAFIDGPCCSAAWEHVVINGGGATGSIPLIIDTTEGHLAMSFSCFSCSVDHAGSGQHEIEVRETSGVTQVNFYNLWVETNASAPATVPHIEIAKSRGGVNFYGGTVVVENQSETVPVIDIANRVDANVNVYGMYFRGGVSPAPRIRDNARGLTVATNSIANIKPLDYSTLSPTTRMETGTTAMSGGSATAKFFYSFLRAPRCIATDTTSPASVQATSTTTAITLVGTGSDVISWACFGQPN